ncbi:hypothetical protein ACFSHQ_10645 [Gemmobacter lanyuensis]
MTQITRDSLLNGPLPLAEGEVLLASFRADRTAYVRAQLILSVVFGTVAGVVLVVMQNPHPGWVRWPPCWPWVRGRLSSPPRRWRRNGG